MALPNSILESAERVLDFHQSTKLDDASPLAALDVNAKPIDLWQFVDHPKVALDTDWIDMPVGVIPLLQNGLEAVPQAMHSPAQDIRTLSTWLYMAAGSRRLIRMPWGDSPLRAISSIEKCYSDEVYVAIFSIDGIEPGFYHYNHKEHSLCKLREAGAALSLLKRGRPDLQFLSSVPCAILVSSVFCRSSWIYGKRGYRKSLIDAGQITSNLQTVAMGLGMMSFVRLRMSDSPMRELIGHHVRYTFAEAEVVQSMVVWADEATVPHAFTQSTSTSLPPIARLQTNKPVGYGSILAAHGDASSVSVAIREVRPPLTDITPVPPDVQQQVVAFNKEKIDCYSLTRTLTDPIDAKEFANKPISHNLLNRLSKCAFRGGTFFPLRPDGVHTATVRPFWVTLNVKGFEPGIWWYDPVIDRWALLNRGEYKKEVSYLTRRHPEAQSASAICVMVSNLKMLMTQAGPDLYRLAHIEAGIAAQRLCLASHSIGLACNLHTDFADDLWRSFLGLGSTGWEVLATLAIGGMVAKGGV